MHPRPARHNPAGLLLAGIIAGVILGAVTLAVLIIGPHDPAPATEATAGADVVAFSRFNWTAGPLEIHLSDGFLVHAVQNGEVTGAVLLGHGHYSITFPPAYANRLAPLAGGPRLRDLFVAAFLPGDYQAVERLRDAAVKAEAPAEALASAVQEAQAVLGRVHAEAFPARPAGFFFAALGVETRPAMLFGHTYGTVGYELGAEARVTLYDRGAAVAAFPYPDTAQFGYERGAPRSSLLRVLIFAGAAGLLLILVFILTADMEIPGPLPAGVGPPQLWAVGAILLADVGMRWASLALRWPPEAIPAAQLVLAGLVVAAAARHRALPVVGITRRYLGRGLLIAAAVGFFGAVAGALSFPTGIKPIDPGAAVGILLWPAGLGSVARELLYRGVIFTGLEGRWGTLPALAASAWLGGLAYLVPRLVLFPEVAGSFLATGLVLVPAVGLLSGMMFLRSRNVVAAGGLAAFLDVFPRLLSF